MPPKKDSPRSKLVYLQHLSEKMLTIATKLAHPKENPVVEVAEKVKHTENQKIYEILVRS